MAIPGKPRYFPDPACSDSDGLVAVDSRINVRRMLDAYRNGIFPWPASWEGKWFVGWHSPDPRAVLPLESLHISKRLARKLRSQRFRFRWNSDFDSVIDHCATVGDREKDRWLSRPLLATVKKMHKLGHACSIEVYESADGYDQICGGLYGIRTGGCFAAESMFHLTSDASKAAICALVALLQRCDYRLLDIQQPSTHLLSMGAVEVARSDYLVSLSAAADLDRPWPPVPAEPVAYAALQ